MTTVNYVSAAAQRAHLPSTSLFNGTGLYSNFPLFSPLSAGHLNIDPAGIASVLTRWAQGKNPPLYDGHLVSPAGNIWRHYHSGRITSAAGSHSDFTASVITADGIQL
jgi:hypothetical protein